MRAPPWLGLLLLIASACSSTGGDVADDGDGNTGGDGTSANATSSPSASTGAQVEPLSGLEQSLVGVWSGAATNDTTTYFVLTADRKGCTWERDGDDFGVRYVELQFVDWKLHEDSLDADGRMRITLTPAAGGEAHDIDRYDADTDRLYVAGGVSTGWRDILIDCAAKGTNATATDVKRGGILGGG